MNSSSAQAKKWIIASISIAVIGTLLMDIVKGEAPKLRVIIGGLFAAVVLTLLAEIEPEAAAGIAVIILVGALLSKGTVFDRFIAWSSGKVSSGKTTLI